MATIGDALAGVMGSSPFLEIEKAIPLDWRYGLIVITRYF